MTVVFFTGAGISTASGIPDYRGPAGTWTTDPDAEALVDYTRYTSDRDIRRRSWLMRAASPIWAAQPNPAHRAIAAVRDAFVITQNIDRLHHRAGSPPARVIELHGNVFRTACLDCRETSRTEAVLRRVAAGEADPACEVCGGVLKPATVMFGEPIDEATLGTAVGLASRATLFIMVGTSLQVYPAASLARLAAIGGAELIIVNDQPTDYDDLAAKVIRDPAESALPELLQRHGLVTRS